MGLTRRERGRRRFSAEGNFCEIRQLAHLVQTLMLFQAQNVMGLFKHFNDITPLVNKLVYTCLPEVLTQFSRPPD